MPVDQESLKDAIDVLALKPEFTPEEKIVADKLRPQLKVLLRPEVRLELEAEYIKRQQAFEEATVATSRQAVEQAIKNWKEEQEPLTPKDIQTLLKQEYLEFEVPCKLRNGKIEDFVLQELPQEIEIKFVEKLRKHFIPLMKKLTAAEFKLDMGSSNIDKLQSILEAVPGVLDVCVDLVVIAINPFGDHKHIDASWVKKNISSHRILAIILGQMEVGRYRDFFLNGFKLSKSLRQSQ
jgi:hypothetical protein